MCQSLTRPTISIQSTRYMPQDWIAHREANISTRTSTTMTRRNLSQNGPLTMASIMLASFLVATTTQIVLAQSSLMVLPDGIETVLGFKPRSSFKCTKDGYFGDIENDCRIFHLCQQTKYPNGKTEWRHWTYACGNQTMFNQLTLTCAFVDEAVPCQHAPQFQYLNEVLHRPKEPFLTDADVTSGVSYYQNRLLSDNARARAEQQQQQSQPQPTLQPRLRAQQQRPRQQQQQQPQSAPSSIESRQQFPAPNANQRPQVIRARSATNAQQLNSVFVARQPTTVSTPTTTTTTSTTTEVPTTTTTATPSPTTATSSRGNNNNNSKLIDFAIVTNHETTASRQQPPALLKARRDGGATVRRVPLTPIMAATFASTSDSTGAVSTTTAAANNNNQRPARQLQSSVDLASEVSLGPTTTASANAITATPTPRNLFAQPRQQPTQQPQRQQPTQQQQQRFANRFTDMTVGPINNNLRQQQQQPQRPQQSMRRVNLGRELLRQQLPLTMANQLGDETGRMQPIFTTMIDLRPTMGPRQQPDNNNRQLRSSFQQARVQSLQQQQQQHQQQQRLALANLEASLRRQQQQQLQQQVLANQLARQVGARWINTNASLPLFGEDGDNNNNNQNNVMLRRRL